MHKFGFEAIGTAWEVDTSTPLDAETRRRILDRIDAFDCTYSRFRKDSLITRVATADAGGKFDFPGDACELFDLYDRLHGATSGAVDPLVGRDLELLGYDANYSLSYDPLKIARYSYERPRWRDDVLRHRCRITTKRPVVIDVGAAGKGYLVDIVAELLRGAGHRDYVVDASGDLTHSGPNVLDIGLEHPLDPTLAIGVARLYGRALCASATTRRAWGSFHHVLDGRTGVPVRDIIASWVIADNAMLADGLATALFFTPPARLAEHFDFAFVRMFADGRAEISPNFDGELFV